MWHLFYDGFCYIDVTSMKQLCHIHIWTKFQFLQNFYKKFMPIYLITIKIFDEFFA